jgi:hypothetical protein
MALQWAVVCWSTPLRPVGATPSFLLMKNVEPRSDNGIRDRAFLGASGHQPNG